MFSRIWETITFSMKTFTNLALVENRTKWAKRVAPLTMLFLVGGLIVNFMSISQPQYFQYAVVMLGLGFLMSIISSHLVNHWVREPRADQALAVALKKFGNDFYLFNYTAAKASHVLLTPTRLYVIIPKRHAGEVQVKGRRFSRKFSFVRVLRFFAEEGLGTPVSEAQNHIKSVQQALSSQLDEETVPEIKGLVVFTNKEIKLSISDPVIPVLTISDLKLYLRGHDKNKAIPADVRNQLVKILSEGHQEVK